MKNDMQLLITSRCRLKNYDSIEIKELDKEKELTELFYKHCPSAKRDPDSVSAIIEEVNCHTLTVCMAALTLEASGMERKNCYRSCVPAVSGRIQKKSRYSRMMNSPMPV